MADLIWLVPLLPLVGFCVLLLVGRRIGEPVAGYLGTAMAAGSFLVACGVFLDLLSKPEEERVVTNRLWTWVASGNLDVGATLRVDPLSITMVLFVTGIGSLIHLYAVGYMHGDPRFSRFFVYLNLFLFSMLCLVLGDNLLLLFLGWEGVGTCSYLLISFWFERKSAATAGKKAFVVNRIGDFGLMMGMFLLIKATGSLSFDQIFSAAKGGGIDSSTATWACVALFLGACGKSAQLPLYVWLPDAMEGPTPVSALIHAATMVTAGVYLMMRMEPVLHIADPWVFGLIAWTGAITALFAALIATAQDDIKRILAYSTISQLGYMFLAVGSHANAAAAFHMITHAFFKALMFLGAGSVIHGMHDQQDIKAMGGLRRWMPLTFGTYLVGWLAISGIPPFSGFWSKDEVLLSAYEYNRALWAIGLVTALLTAYYMSRQFFLAFFGKERFLGGDHPVKPHESPMLMVAPLGVLAVLAFAGGAMNLPFSKSMERLAHWLAPSVGEHEFASSGGTKFVLAVVATFCGVAGIAIARQLWLKRDLASNAALEVPILREAFKVDQLTSAVIEKPGRRIADLAADVLDAKVIDGGLVAGPGRIVTLVGSQIRRLQTGYVRQYAAVIGIGAVALLAYAVIQAGV
jgi:NADH-quinone oxidoreductase subunit L